MIRHILNELGSRLIPSATTGKAAFLIYGDTIHAIAKLTHDGELTDAQVKSVKDRLNGIES